VWVVKNFRGNLYFLVNRDGTILPGVETSVVQTKVESWGGVEDPVDAVLLISVLGHLHQDDRRALFHTLMTRYLSDAGRLCLENVHLMNYWIEPILKFANFNKLYISSNEISVIFRLYCYA